MHLKEKLDKYNYYFLYLLGCVSSKPAKKKKKKKKKKFKQTIFDNSLSIHKFEELLKDVDLDYCIQYLQSCKLASYSDNFSSSPPSSSTPSCYYSPPPSPILTTFWSLLHQRQQRANHFLFLKTYLQVPEPFLEERMFLILQ